jgi:hypothetical protein
LRPGHAYYLGFWSPVDTTFSVSSSTNGGLMLVTNTIAFYGGSISNVIPGYSSMLYRMDVPPEATRIRFNAGNSVNVVLALEQGSIAQLGGPAHWTSYLYNNSQYGNQANVGLNQSLLTPNNWPWQPRHSYYLTVTNTSADPEPFGVNVAYPSDLVPVAFLAPTNVTSTRPNPVIELAWCVTNRGMASASGGWHHRIWFSVNGALDGQSASLGDFYFDQPVAAGESYWQTNLVTLPLGGSRSYTLFVQSDIYDGVYESNELNNVLAAMPETFTLIPPDLMPLSVVAPATPTSVLPNPTIEVAWGATNRGTGPASSAWYDRVWFSTNGLLDGQSLILGDFYFSQDLAAGDTYWLTNSIILPMTNSGSYWLFIKTDVYDWLFESNKLNNVSAAIPGTFSLINANTTRITGGRFLSPDSFQLDLYDGALGTLYTLQGSTNLLDWANLLEFTFTNSPTSIVDPAATNKQQFYRTRLP